MASSNDGRFLGAFSLALPPLCLGGRLAGFGGLWRALAVWRFGGLAEALADSGMLWRGLARPWRTMADTGAFRWTLVGFGRPLPNLGKRWRGLAAFCGPWR